MDSKKKKKLKQITRTTIMMREEKNGILFPLLFHIFKEKYLALNTFQKISDQYFFL